MPLPDRVTLSTCIGCGAMQRWGTCEGACSEHELNLVGAVQYRRLSEVAAVAAVRVHALRVVVEELARDPPGTGESKVNYRTLQRAARVALRRDVLPEVGVSEQDEPLDRATAWWCAECGGVDAPQPCLGICLWRPVDWVNEALYEEERSRAVASGACERALVSVLRLAAFVTPRDGQWASSSRALRARARAVLRTRDPLPMTARVANKL